LTAEYLSAADVATFATKNIFLDTLQLQQRNQIV